VDDFFQEERLVLSILSKKDIEIAPRNASLSQKTIDSLTDNDSQYKKMKILGFKGRDYQPQEHIRPAAKRQLQAYFQERMRFKSAVRPKARGTRSELEDSLRLQRLVSRSMRQRMERDTMRRRRSAMLMFRE
jgi:hypothetical protein